MLATSSSADDDPQQPARIMLADIAGDALAGDPADAGADLLDRRHQRPGEQHDPGHAVAELRADLRIGGDAARIVVGCAGDQPGPEKGQEPAPARRARAPMVRDPPGERSRDPRARGCGLSGASGVSVNPPAPRETGAGIRAACSVPGTIAATAESGRPRGSSPRSSASMSGYPELSPTLQHCHRAVVEHQHVDDASRRGGRRPANATRAQYAGGRDRRDRPGIRRGWRRGREIAPAAE